GAVVAVDLTDGLFARPREAGDFPRLHSGLQQPGDAGVLERVRGHLLAQLGELARGVEAPPDPLNRLSPVFTRAHRRDPPPTAQMRQKGVRDRTGRAGL